jgi:diguanylate cyclase (GGDEF)-like protein
LRRRGSLLTKRRANDRNAADRDQTLADRDQEASDSDREASDSDAADSIRDAEASAQDQRTADRTPSAGPRDAADRESARHSREEVSAHREATRTSRAESAATRDVTAAERDMTATARDETASQRDAADQELEQEIAESDLALSEKMARVRATAAAARQRAALDRERAARDREIAAEERARMARELETAHLDDLTGALRRGAGWLALAHEIDRARRGDGRFVIAFADVDRMKDINDRDGHAAGDHVLQVLARTIEKNVRSFDPVVRYGGDEFVCGFAGVDIEDVDRRFVAIADALRLEIGVEISVGLAAIVATDTLDLVVARADIALREIKRSRGIGTTAQA